MPAHSHSWRGTRCLFIILHVLVLLTAVSAHALPLVEQGQPRAMLVTADEPSPIARYAAEELAHHVEKATGVALAIVGESQAPVEGRHVYIGVTEAARAQGIRPDELPPDALLLRSVGNNLYVLGIEDDQDPLDQSARSGTLYGVYELLHRYVGVRWLWPGDLGTHIPRTNTIRVPDGLDEVVEPALRFRRFRTRRVRWQASNYNAQLGRLAFSRQGSRDYDTDLHVYLRRHRVGETEPKPPVGHYFAGWWERYGEEHPEWFMMRADGERGPESDARGADDQSPSPQRHVGMCVSNPELHRYIVEHAWDGGPYLRLGEVDRRIFCQCENCLAWDGPQPEDPPHVARNLYRPRVVTDRYARFWKTIQQMARKRNPDVVVTTFLYWNYLPVPPSGIELNENIYGEYVPWGQSEVTYFPMSEEAYAWNEQQWEGWHKTGITMAYRPNYFHGGYVMPHLSTRQVAEFFQFAYRHGMIGFDQDSLHGHWATRGPMLYLHMRLAVDPDADIADIRREYFAAFGPAAEHVERYFDYWEEYARDRPGGALYSPVNAPVAYPAEVFPPARRILEEAREAARQDDLPEYARRVAFLEAGLEHARLTAHFIGFLDRGQAPGDPRQLAEAQAALKELIAFRREHEHLYIADYIDAARRENRWLDIDTLLRDE